MAYLVAYVNGEKFTPEIIRDCSGRSVEAYQLNHKHEETVRLVEFLGHSTRFAPDTDISIVIKQEERKILFLTNTVKTYFLNICGWEYEFQSDLIYLED